MNGQFEGKVALVTGAASGIGKACALAFANSGARTVLADLAEDHGQAVVEEIRKSGGEAVFHRTDVTQGESIEGLIKTALDSFGRLDYACNNAGIEGKQALLTEYTEEMWNLVLATNLTGTWLCMKHEIPAMLKNGGGAIVNVSSILGSVGMEQTSAYTASKHGVEGLTKTAAIEFGEKGIRINGVAPAFIVTPMLERYSKHAGPDFYTRSAALHPMNRMGQPDEVAEAVIWLCSDKASFVTGHTLHVDGGYLAK